jgi:hypothetical protein
MAQSVTFSRPLTTTRENKTTSQSAAVHESGATVTYIDDTATVNGALRLLGRTKRTREVNGEFQRFKIEYLSFVSSGDQTFTAGATTTPFTDAEADEITLVAHTPWDNMHTLFVNAGDTTST